MFMQNLLPCLSTFSQPRLWPSRTPKNRWQGSLLGLGFAVALVGAMHPSSVRADSPETAPAQIKETLAQIDAAANSRNAQSVLQFYSPAFTHSDGLTRQTLEQALSKLWERYPMLKYRTELKSWKREGKGFRTETITYIDGVQKANDREYRLSATVQSSQQFEDQKIVRQDILNERSQITSGSNPPSVKLNMPERVTPGQEFSMDAVVQEPLGDNLLLGAALEEPVKPEGIVNPAKVDLELLPAGGIFKVGRAPTTSESRWVSAVLVRQDGMTMVTQRLQVAARKK